MRKFFVNVGDFLLEMLRGFFGLLGNIVGTVISVIAFILAALLPFVPTVLAILVAIWIASACGIL